MVVADLVTAGAPIATLAPSSPYTVEAPRWNGNDRLMRKDDFPPLVARSIRDVIFMINSSAMVKQDRLYLPERMRNDRKRITTSGPRLFFVDERIAVGATSAKESIEGGIFIGGSGSTNWYHFLIECLPKAYLARRLPETYDDLPLLVPDTCRHIPSFADALKLFSGKRQVKYLNPKIRYRADELVIVDEVAIGPFNMTPGHWPVIDDYAQHDNELRHFIGTLQSELLEDDHSVFTGRRIFLKRSTKHRNYNHEEICAIAERYGFEPVSPETLTLKKQAELFASADAVIGASGAAWVGMIFRKRPMTALSWLPSPYSEFCCYSSLARLLRHDLHFIEAKSDKALQSTSEASLSDYTICPVEFEAAIQRTFGKAVSANRVGARP